MKNHVKSTNQVCDHLGIPHCGHLVEAEARWNSSLNKPVAQGPLGPIITSQFYKNVRPLLGRGVRILPENLVQGQPAFAVWTETAWELARVRLEADAALLASLTNGQFGLDPTWLKQPFLPLR